MTRKNTKNTTANGKNAAKKKAGKEKTANFGKKKAGKGKATKSPQDAKATKRVKANAVNATTANTANDTTTANETHAANDTATATADNTDNTAHATPANPANTANATPASASRLSALDAAALVLAKSPKALTTPELIGVMAVRKLWFSPGGKTPAATLYAAITREIATKGSQSRFTKAAPGRFAANTANTANTANDNEDAPADTPSANTANTANDDGGSPAAHAAPAEPDNTPFSENDVYRL